MSMTLEDIEKRQQELDETRINLLAQLNSIIGSMNENARWMELLKKQEG